MAPTSDFISFTYPPSFPSNPTCFLCLRLRGKNCPLKQIFELSQISNCSYHKAGTAACYSRPLVFLDNKNSFKKITRPLGQAGSWNQTNQKKVWAKPSYDVIARCSNSCLRIYFVILSPTAVLHHRLISLTYPDQVPGWTSRQPQRYPKKLFFLGKLPPANPAARSRLRYSSAPTQVRKGEKNSPFPPSIPKDTFAWSETFPPTARTGLEAIGGTDKGLHSILMKCHFRCAGENTERASEGVVCHHLNPASRSNKTVMLAPARIVTCH